MKQTIKGRPGIAALYFLAATLTVIWLCLMHYTLAPGVPISHETLSYLQRTALYADHFRLGDLLPLWASGDAFGMGTPLPLFYHKTFYYMSGLLSVLLGSTEKAIVAALASWMLIGAYGMRRAAGRLTDNGMLQACAALAFLLSNYAFTDWLVRGAMAEFSAMMLVPWLMGWCLALVKEGRFSFSITFILFLLVQSHNITAVFAVIPLSLAAAVFAYRQRMEGIRRVWRRAALSVFTFFLLLAPQLVLQKIMLADYDPGKITQLGYKASENFKPAARYFWDREHVWLADWTVFTVQIDFGIWIAALLIAGGWMLKKRGLVSGAASETPGLRWMIAFLAANMLVFLLLQFRISIAAYENIPLFQFLQFPWRLMAYATPIGILLVSAGLCALVDNPRRLSITAVAWALAFLVPSPIFHDYGWPYTPQDEIDALLSRRDPALTGTVLQGIGEYYPRIHLADGTEMAGIQVVGLYRAMHDEGRQLQVRSGSCEVTDLDPRDGREVLVRRFAYRCLSDSVVALPLSYSRLMSLQEGTTHEPRAYYRLRDDPRVHVRMKPGQGTLTARLPSTAAVAQSLRQQVRW